MVDFDKSSKENNDMVGEGLKLFAKGISPYVDQEMRRKYGVSWRNEVEMRLRDNHREQDVNWNDPQAFLVMFPVFWNEVFMRSLGHKGRTWVFELRDTRNRWAHMEEFNDEDTFRDVDTIWRLLDAVSSPVAEKAYTLRQKALDKLTGDRGETVTPEPKGVRPSNGKTSMENGRTIGVEELEPSDEGAGTSESAPVDPPAPIVGKTPAISEEDFHLKCTNLGFKTNFFVVHIRAYYDGKLIDYHGRFSEGCKHIKDQWFKVDKQKSEDKKIRSAVIEFIQSNWSGDDVVKVSIVGDSYYTIKVGDDQEYEVKVNPAYNKEKNRLLSCDFKREDDESMMPYGDIIKAMKNKLK